MRAHPHKFGLLGSHINSDLLSSPANDLFATPVHQGSHPPTAQRSAPKIRDRTRHVSAPSWIRPNIIGSLSSSLLHKTETGTGALRERLKWVWVKPTKTRTIFFLTTCHENRTLCLLYLRSRSKTRDLRASETRHRPPTPWAVPHQSSENNCGQVCR